MDMQTSPFSYTLGWKMGVWNVSVGGRCGYVGGNFIRALKQPPAPSKSALSIRKMPSEGIRWFSSTDHEMCSPSHPCTICSCCPHSPPYKLSCSSSSISIISQSNILSFSRPQLIPGMSLSVCICLYCRPKRIAALDCPPGDAVLLSGGDAMVRKYGTGSRADFLIQWSEIDVVVLFVHSALLTGKLQ